MIRLVIPRAVEDQEFSAEATGHRADGHLLLPAEARRPRLALEVQSETLVAAEWVVGERLEEGDEGSRCEGCLRHPLEVGEGVKPLERLEPVEVGRFFAWSAVGVEVHLLEVRAGLCYLGECGVGDWRGDEQPTELCELRECVGKGLVQGIGLVECLGKVDGAVDVQIS